MNKGLDSQLLKARDTGSSNDLPAPGDGTFDRPDLYDDFADMENDGFPCQQVQMVRHLYNGLISIQTLSKIQAGFAGGESLVQDGFPSARLSKQGQTELAQAITLLSDYLADDVVKLTRLLKTEKMGAGR